MIIYPAIDLRRGKVVRLEQGRAEAQTVYGDDPVAVAAEFREAGATHLHMVDLDGAFTGEFQNLELVRAVARDRSLFVELGGGLRTEEAIRLALETGVQRAVIGTRACESIDFVRAMVGQFGGERIAVGIDARDGIVSTRGWTAPSQWRAVDLGVAVAGAGVGTIIYTDIATDGMFTGPNLPALRELLTAVPHAQVIASGGVASLEHVRALLGLGETLHGAIIGKALYDGKLSLRAAIAACS